MATADSQSFAVPGLPWRDRIIICAGIVAVTAIAWIDLARMPMAHVGAASSGAVGMMMPMAHQWSMAHVWLTFWMWAVMMVAMMLPTASPMLLMYARIARSRETSAVATRRVWMLAAGYLVAWTLFSVGATALQYGLARTGIIDATLTTTPVAGGIILIAAGIYQLTPLKNACMNNCRSPIGYFMTEWREGAGGAWRMGLEQGTSCVGCCWVLMLLLFVAGAMNLAWCAGITVFVLLEKVAPFGRVIVTGTGILLLASGIAMIAIR